jgi:hypothetical protein
VAASAAGGEELLGLEGLRRDALLREDERLRGVLLGGYSQHVLLCDQVCRALIKSLIVRVTGLGFISGAAAEDLLKEHAFEELAPGHLLLAGAVLGQHYSRAPLVHALLLALTHEGGAELVLPELTG